MMLEARRIVDNLLECRKPIVSAVNGYAMGLGATVALLCDVVVAGALGRVRRHPREDGHRRRRRRPGHLAAAHGRQPGQVLPDDRRPAQRPRRPSASGLVNFVVDDDTVVDAALEVAARLAAGPLQAIIASKMPINSYMRMVSNLVLPLSLALEGRTMSSADHREAVAAFQEKRPPSYTGR